MERHHLNPEQAGQAFLDLGARRLLPMHWGTFQLTDEPLAEPAERIQQWWRTEIGRSSRSLEILPVGGIVDLAADD
jgi:L-ascorbate metabolism protein UlaG (beta-lactamase superfamily)